MTTLVTGASGFSGKYLVDVILGDKVLLSRTLTDTVANTVKCDLLDSQNIRDVIENIKPEKLYHLAGSFSNDYSQDASLNVAATKNILESVKNVSPHTRVLLIGSAAEYGLVSSDQCPIDEEFPLRACNVYGLTKIYQKYLMDYYVNVFSLDIVMARPFNLYGRNISQKLFIGKVYNEIEKLKNGATQKITLGNLSSRRDYIHIEEAVEHYIKIMECGKKGEIYNVGRGVPTKTGDILKSILQDENIDESVVNSDMRDLQDNDSDCIYADISKLRGLYNE